jgi:four helix bundle protein
MAYESSEDLEVWQKACVLAVRVYEALENFRDFGLKDQMTRSVVSIASNIAEGA